MNILSSPISQAISGKQKSDFAGAGTNFKNIESIFNRVNAEYLSSEQTFLNNQFRESLAEDAYNSLRNQLGYLRHREQVADNTTLVTTSKILAHERILQEDPAIKELEGTIARNQLQIVEYQASLNTVKASSAVARFNILSGEIKGLSKEEAILQNLITEYGKKGKDTSALEEKLAKKRKQIEVKTKEISELQPEYDKIQEIQNSLQELLRENAELTRERLARDPELVRYKKVNSFFNNVVQGNGNGLGIKAKIEKHKNKTSAAGELYEERSEDTKSFQELLDKNLKIRNTVKSDLESAKSSATRK